MILMDVNILVYARREYTGDHSAYRDWVEERINGGSAYGVSELVLSALIRAVSIPMGKERFKEQIYKTVGRKVGRR